MVFYEGLKRMPVIRVLLPFITGIVLQDMFRIPLHLLITVCGFAFCLLVFTRLYRPLNTSYSKRWVYGFVLNIFVLSFAMTLSGKRTEYGTSRGGTCQDGFVIVRVIDFPVEREGSYRVLIKPLSRVSVDTICRFAGKAVAWFEKDSLAVRLTIGDILAVPDKFREITNYGNPWEFDYSRYMRINGVTSMIYLPSGDWIRSGRRQGGILTAAGRLRERLLGIMDSYGIEGREHEIAGAVLLGYRSGLDSELRQAFASSGAMHILAVSGLHAGIVYIFLHWLLGTIKMTNRYRLFRPAIIVMAIWSYAMLTGLSPPVVRASAMFTLIAAGKSLRRPANIYNTLAAAALIHLIADPPALFKAGFQLSYIAVAGIAYYQPLLYSLIRSGNHFADKIWALTTVSLSAQLSVFPLGLYYFNQFPNLFLLTNLLVVPVTMLILYSGFMLFIFSPVSIVASAIASVLNIMLKALGVITGTISSLPFSSISGIYISTPSLIILYGIIVCVTLFLACKKQRYLQYAIILAIAGFSLRAVYQTGTAGQQVFIVYNSSGNSLYGFISGNRNILVSDSFGDSQFGPFIAGGRVSLPYEAAGARLRLNARDISFYSREEFFSAFRAFLPETFHTAGRFAGFAGYRIWFAGNDTGISRGIDAPLQADLVIIDSGFRGSIEGICKYVIPGRVIIDSSTGYFSRERIIRQCLEAGIDYHDVVTSGAFVIKAARRH